MADPRSPEEIEAALKKQLHDTMDQILEICKRNITDVAPTPSVPGAKHSREIFYIKDQPVNTSRLMALEELYREESKLKNDFQDVMLSKIWNPATPQPTPNLPGNAAQRMIQQGPRLTTSDYRLLAKATHQQITNDVDRLAKRNNLIDFAATQSMMNVPSHVTETLEDFFEEYGEPNSAEIYMLTEALDVPAEAVKDFFKHKVAISADIIAAKNMLQMKCLLREVQKRGGLQEMQQKARDQEIAVEAMD